MSLITDNMDRAAQARAEELEGLVAEIKSIVGSGFYTDAMVRSFIKKAIQKAGY